MCRTISAAGGGSSGSWTGHTHAHNAGRLRQAQGQEEALEENIWGVEGGVGGGVLVDDLTALNQLHKRDFRPLLR